MPRIERYLIREFALSFAAATLVLTLVGLGGIAADLLAEIARGRTPAALLLSQLGLRIVHYQPILLPLSLFIGLMLAISRLYRDSEMAVLNAVGFGPRQLLRPVALITLPVVLVIGLCSLWAVPTALRASRAMVETANRSLLVAGLEPGRFVELPGKQGVLYVTDMDADGSHFQRLFLHRENEGRLDVITASSGELFFDGLEERYLRLLDGFRVEGSPDTLDFRLMRFERNDIRVPPRSANDGRRPEALLPTQVLLAMPGPFAWAELHWRLGPPLLAAVLAVLAIPLARSSPRAPRYGLVLLALLGYLFYMNLLILGQSWLGNGQTAAPLGLWWLHAPAALIAFLLLARDGSLGRKPRRRR
ncbi:MAG: LPS export ABC transporter permease LptF [Gammaproteobacteria bacterium HGW-Gammaproteobacteria-5]|nr:MAG: LPS export ABC transporter permease LptF [Gammaproteobacteria bacterium HGW-Gammaproteobacteria-5]